MLKGLNGSVSDVRVVVPAADEITLSNITKRTPDIDLKRMAEWAMNCLIESPRKHLNYEPVFQCHPLRCPPIPEGHDPVVPCDTDARMDWEWYYMRDISGSKRGLDVEKAFHKRMRDYVDSEGLVWAPPGCYNEGDINAKYEKKDYIIHVWGSTKILKSLSEDYIRTKNPESKELARKIMLAQKKLVTWDDKGRCWFPGGMGALRSDLSVVPNGWNRQPAPIVGPLVTYWLATGDPEALPFAKANADGVIGNCQPDGIRFSPDGSHNGHSHGTMKVVWGIAHLGMVTGERKYILFAKQAWDRMLEKMGTGTGWFAAAIDYPGNETCCLSDMMSIACILGQAGYTEYYDYTERYMRNYMGNLQFIVTPEFEAYYRKLNEGVAEDKIRQGLESLRKFEGGIIGGSGLNDYENVLLGGAGCFEMYGCCVPEGMRSIYTTWTNTIDCRPASKFSPAGVYVNMSFSRHSEWGEVTSFMPDQGRLTVNAAIDDTFFLRPPHWAPKDQVHAFVGEQQVPTEWTGDYVRFNANSGDVLTITYPLIEFTQQVGGLWKKAPDLQMTFKWRGNMVLSSEPAGGATPLFTGKPRVLPEPPGSRGEGKPTKDLQAVTMDNSLIAISLLLQDNEIITNELVNRSSNFNWAAENGSIGPLLGIVDKKAPLTLEGIDKQERRSLQTRWQGTDGIKMDWSVTVLPDVGILEFGSVVSNSSGKPIKGINSLAPLSMQIRSDQGRLRLHWLRRNSYRMDEVDFDGNFSISGGSGNYADASGWLAIENTDKKEILFIGILWESNWHINLGQKDGSVLVSCTLEGFEKEIEPGSEIESPVAFVGTAHGDLDDSLRYLHDYLKKHVMPPKPKDFPWVTYDIWGTEGTDVEKIIVSEIDFARGMGVEVFYHDASWYDGSCKNGSGDWFTGVGNYAQEDRIKFPSGLAELSRKVHQAGMKFGLWFAPQVVDSHLVGSVIPKEWIAMNNGEDITLDLHNGWPPITRICLGDPDVVSHLKNTLSSAIVKYDLDWLKWDNSGLADSICNRADHGHQAGDGDLAVLKGQYEIYDYLHKRFPDLILENCGAPSRVDYGLARYARANWLSDNTENALRCRRSQIHGSHALPSGYNYAWVVKKGGELDEQKDPEILDTIIRSRMVGLFGMGILHGTLPERFSIMSDEVKDALKRNIANYKRYRHLLTEDVYHVLPLSDKPEEWDGIQFSKRDGTEAVLIVFRGESPESSKLIRLRGLKQNADFILTSLNTNKSTKMPSSMLANEGMAVSLPKVNTSDIYLIKAD